MSVDADAKVTSKDKKARRSGLSDTVRVVIHALILAMIVRVFLFQPFNIPSGSMIPTLLVGDYLFVSKFSYGYSRFSLPFSPDLFGGRVWAAEPERGDVAVFKLPRDNETDYIKRVIGLPGDEIQITDGILHINGKPVPRRRIDDFVMRDGFGNDRTVRQFEETLPNGTSYTVLDLVENSFGDNTGVYKVPEGHFFMMGDNRDNSTDSRVQSAVGYVPAENLIGRAEVIFFSAADDAGLWQVWRWPTTIRWERFFESVD